MNIFEQAIFHAGFLEGLSGTDRTLEDGDREILKQCAETIRRQSTEGTLKDAALDKIHKLAAAQWNEGTTDGWLKIMQLADPSTRVSGRPDV